MLVRKTKIQLVVFTIISIVAIVYALARFTDVEKVFGQGGYTVELDLNEAGGIFTGAEVTYRGYNIGRVGQLQLTRTGLRAQLNIEPDTPKVPKDLHVVVANRSAVGEQYIDLQPAGDDGPYLAAGSRISAENTETPVETEKVIGDLSSLAKSVPTESLRTVVDESYDAFRGTGDDLSTLMDTTREFTRVAQQYLPQTVQLLDSGSTVLRTQNELAPSMRSFSQDLASLSDTLKSSDGDLRRLIDATPQAADQVSGLLKETGPGLSSLVANLLTTSNLLATRQNNLEQMFVTYPAVAAGAFSVVPGDGTAHLGLVLNQFDPPSCTKGYVDPSQYRAGNDTSSRAPDADAYCAEPKGSPINVRGSQNVPYNGVPQPPTPVQVENNKDREQEELRERRQVPGPAGGQGVAFTSLGQLLGLP